MHAYLQICMLAYMHTCVCIHYTPVHAYTAYVHIYLITTLQLNGYYFANAMDDYHDLLNELNEEVIKTKPKNQLKDTAAELGKQLEERLNQLQR